MKHSDTLNNRIICKNCATEFEGSYCPQCGQSITDYEKPFGLVIYDLMGNIFAFDTRLWRTLKAVLFQPGKMAGEFIKGHRVKYMPPFRLYVFVSFIFFVMLNYNTQNGLNESKEFNQLQASLVDSIWNRGGIDISIGADSVHYEATEAVRETKADIEESEEKALKVEDKIKDIISHPDFYMPQFFKYFSWILFFLMPLYGSFLWLFFRKKYRFYLGHVIFAVNQHSFLFIIFILMMGINFIFPNKDSSWEGWLIWLVPVYSIIGARKLYQRRWRTIILKLMAIFFMYSFLLLIGVGLAALIAFS
ncbi:DUF3667 domain-containing protein [Labilibacter sediminis]|nr:DUF3667 domain-containing protein [Labilibacter sediminis]